jgi:hypothetical protein
VAHADQDDLGGGVFIAHYAPSLVYTTDTPAGGWGEALQGSADAIMGCGDQVNRLDGPGDHMMWFIISAWAEDKVWKTTQVGFQAYDPDIWTFQNNGPIYPDGATGIEIYTDDFPHGVPPGGNSGVVCGPSDVPWGPANFEPVWWFEGYAYGESYGTTLLQIDADPSTAFGGWYNTLVPPGQYTAACFGALGVNMDGVYCCPEGDVPTGACCILGECFVMTEADCAAEGGDYLGDGIGCDPNPCPPVGACCVSGYCYIYTVLQCEAAVGVYLGDGTGCDPNPCPAVCCHGADCHVLTEVECSEMGGVWHPEQPDCVPPDFCIVPVRETTWGSIKAIYR